MNIGYIKKLCAAFLVCACLVLPSQDVLADPTIELHEGASGPAGTGVTTNTQNTWFYLNTDNPAGNTFTTYVQPTPLPTSIGMQVSLSNFNPALIAQTVNGPLPALVFGGTPSASTTLMQNELLSRPLNAVGSATDNLFTSTGAASAGTGIDRAVNSGLFLATSAQAVCDVPVATRPATNARIFVAEMTLTFSRPVTNPIIHFVGLGGNVGTNFSGTGPGNAFATEFDALDGLSLTKMSGNTSFSIVGNAINNPSALPGSSCAADIAGCGSVRLNAVNDAVYRFNVYLKGAGTGDWCGLPPRHAADGWMLSASVDPTPIINIRKTSVGATGTFNFSGNNGFGADQVTTTTTGSPQTVNGGPRPLSSSFSATTITEAANPGWRVSNISCTGVPAGSYTTDLATGTLTLDPGVTQRVPLTGATSNSYATAPTNIIQCVFENTRIVANLSITKTNTPGSGVSDQTNDNVLGGSTTTYSLVVTNSGPDAASSIVVRDTPGAGINCPAANPVTITGPGAPVGSFTVGQLTGAGITLNTLNASQNTTLTFSCTVL